MNTRTSLAATMLFVFFFGALGSAFVATAQYVGNASDERQTGFYTPEEYLEIESKRIEHTASIAERHYTVDNPYLVFGVLIILAISGSAAGGLLFFKGRSGKYAAMGKG